MSRICCLLPALFVLAVATASAQSATYEFLPESTISVDGTSNNTPEWTVYATELSGELTLGTGADEAAVHPRVESVRLVVPMRMIKSNKSSLMDRTMYKAMLVDQHPEVIFELTAVESITADTDSASTLEVAGSLTLGPATNEVRFPVSATLREDGIVSFAGNHSLLLSDYGLQAPTAMFGALRTGDEVTVRAELLIGPVE